MVAACNGCRESFAELDPFRAAVVEYSAMSEECTIDFLGRGKGRVGVGVGGTCPRAGDLCLMLEEKTHA